MTDKIAHTLRNQIEQCWRAALAAVEPERALRRALADREPPARPVRLLAIGKAAPGMARAAAGWLAERGASVAGGIVVAHAAGAVPAPLRLVLGDHPVPGERSRRAADALAAAVAAVRTDDDVWVLLSGGASSLVAAPADGVSERELADLWHALLASGLDIHAVNAVRRRFTRWGGGRLARALGGRTMEVCAVSDVPGDHPATIGSGPCAADPTTAAEVIALLERAALLARIPPRLAELLRSDSALATVPPGDPVLAGVRTSVVASNADAVRAAADAARSLGWRVHARAEPITGEAADAGRALAAALLAEAGACIVAGGETTVALGPAGAAGLGGRAQELALAAAEVLVPAGAHAVLLAAGTDGRDGPTDAAGAAVDGHTWQRIRAAGRDPAADLARHDSHPALAAAGALLRTGPTGTNVMDLMIGLHAPADGAMGGTGRPA